MEEEISVAVFEKNARIFNRKSLRRRYCSIPEHLEEYLRVKPLGATTKYVLEVIIDKGYVEKFQDMLKQWHFTLLGSNNYFHIENIVVDYHWNENVFSAVKEQIEAIEKDLESMKVNKKEFKELENDDVCFYFLPYNEKIHTLCKFIEEVKEDIISFCLKEDITIVMNVKGYSANVQGFLGFNFLDAEEEKEEVVIDFTSSFVLKVDFAERMSVYNAAMFLTGIADNEEDLDLLNCHILADHVRFKE